jgi:hypothetical protein
MRIRPVRGRRSAAAVASCLAFSMISCSGCAADRAASNPTSVRRPTIGTGETTVRVLQMNLCNSGRAGCYSGGRAVSTAATLIEQHEPAMVSLNEVCLDDVRVLEQTMSTTFPDAVIASAFKSAQDTRGHAPVRCLNGQQFGDAVLAVVPRRARGFRTYSGVYPDQDLGDKEERVWVCIDLVTQFSACATHTSSTDTTTALAQCRYILNSALPMVSSRDNDHRIILGADLNLRAGGSPSPGSCLPRGYRRADDGALQDVVVSPGIEVRSHVAIDMGGTTDHPGLLVDVVLSRD